MTAPGATLAVAFIPGNDLRLEMRRVLLHSDHRGYTVAALAVGERAWPGARQMVDQGAAQVIVTTGRSAHATEPDVEVAGADRTPRRTPQAAQRTRRLAALVDSGFTDAEILRILRDVR